MFMTNGIQRKPNGQIAVDPLSLNLYNYCHTDPTFYVDTTGNTPIWGQIGTAVRITLLTVGFVVAVVASAGAVGVAAEGEQRVWERAEPYRVPQQER